VHCETGTNCGDVAALINKLTESQYDFDKDCNLVKIDGTNKDGSSYYSNRLDKVIGSDLTLHVAIEPTDRQAEASGGGMTPMSRRSRAVSVVITGKDGQLVTGMNGQKILVRRNSS
jgi:hypothetical protein